MRWGETMSVRVRALVLGLVLVVGSLVPVGGTALAASPVNSISTVNVACTTFAGGGDAFEVTVTFTHRGPAELRIYGLLEGERNDSDHAWFRGTGADTFVGQLWAPTPRYVEAHLLKIDHRTRSLVDIATPVTVGPFDCQA